MAKIVGGKAFKAKLGRISGPEMTREVGAALFVGGQIIENTAAHLITEGSVSGKGHVPSRPGEPPNADTHVLDRNIETVQISPVKVEVSSNAPYAAALEFGTSKMGERPYMRPAVARSRKEVTQLIRSAVAKVASGGKVIP